MRLFKRKPKPPLADAIRMVGDAVEIAYKYLRDRKHMPSEEELRLLDGLVEALWANHATAQYIARNMRQRANGEPEGRRNSLIRGSSIITIRSNCYGWHLFIRRGHLKENTVKRAVNEVS